MKKIQIFGTLVTVLFLSLVIISCNSDLDDYSQNPNDPTDTSPDLLLTAMQVATFSAYSGNNVRIPAMWVQQIAGTSEGQYGAYCNYDVREATIDNDWGTSFENAIGTGKVIVTDFSENYDYYNGIAKILLAFNFGLATDLWGDIPFAEAGKARDGNLNPLYETQENVIVGMQLLLDEAITLLSNNNAKNYLIPGSDDLIFGGNIARWISIAHVLKARYYLRVSLRDSNALDLALNSLSNANLTGIENDMNAVFPNSGGNSKNQWKDFEDNRANYIKMGAYYVDLLKSTNDPRLPYFVAKDNSGNYSGNVLGDITTISSSKVGPAVASNRAPIGLVTYTEAKFIEAEIYIRKTGKDTEAENAFEMAIKSSMDRVNSLKAYFEGNDASLGDISATDIDAFVNSQTTNLTLENILRQKYVALFSSLEPYNDFRRTGFPNLTPNPNAVGNLTKIPVRFPTASTERLYNTNAIVVSDISQNVWWDVD